MRAAVSAILVGLCVPGCELPSPTPFDAGRFDVREATVAPRPDAGGDDVGADVSLVDVTVADVAAASDASSSDVGPSDVPVLCLALANEHAAGVREAQTCVRDEDCDTLVCETLCCACEVFVRGASDALARARDAKTRATASGCVGALPCPRVPCAAPSRAVCSGEGRCVTLREASYDAGADR